MPRRSITLISALLLLLLQLSGCLAQSSSTVSGSSTPTRTTRASASSSTTVSSTASAASSSTSLYLALPTLVACANYAFYYTSPPGPKSIIVFLASNTSAGEMEQIDLSAEYDNRLSGTVSWLCDWPAGADIGFELVLFDQDANRTRSHVNSHVATDSVVVGSGTPLDSSCYADNSGFVNTATILQYASELDASYTYTSGSSSSSQTAGTTSGGTSGSKHNDIAGPVAGGVVGGVAVIAILAGILFWFQRKQAREAALFDGGSTYNNSEKYGPSSRYPPSAYSSGAPGQAGTDVGPLWIPYDENGNPLVGGPAQGETFKPRGEGEQEAANPVRTLAAPGTLPEPMDAGAEARDVPSRPHTTTPPPQAPSPSNEFTPTTAGESHTPYGADDLDDPSSFSPSRSTHGLDDPSSFSPARTS